MIDFQNQTLTSKPLKEIVNATILFRKEETLDQYRKYKEELISNDNDSEQLLGRFSAWLIVLFEQNRSMLEDEWENVKHNIYTDISEIEADIGSLDKDRVIKAYRYIDKFLYSKGITKTDTRENIETRSIIKRNKIAGL